MYTVASPDTDPNPIGWVQIVYLFAITPLQVLAIQRKKKKKKKGTVKEHTTKYKATNYVQCKLTGARHCIAKCGIPN